MDDDSGGIVDGEEAVAGTIAIARVSGEFLGADKLAVGLPAVQSAPRDKLALQFNGKPRRNALRTLFRGDAASRACAFQAPSNRGPNL